MNKKIMLLITGALALMFFFAGCSVDTTESTVQAFVDPYISVHPASRAYKQNEIPRDSVTKEPLPITLEVDVWDWRGEDGGLSYQWYSFDTIQEYLENGGEGMAIPGETRRSYTLPTLNTSPGEKYYYYVTVRNTNPSASGKVTEIIRSEVAIISFLADTAAEYPIITRHPASGRYIFGSSMAPLGVKLKKLTSPGSIISYQWYTSNAKNFENIDIRNGTPVAEGVYESFMANPRTMKLGGNFYWVVIKNNPSDGSYGSATAEISVPARITLDPAARAMQPRIMRQPRDRLYFVGQTATSLSEIRLYAESPDFGNLSYQWYSNTSLSNSGGSLIEDEIGETLTPAINTASAGTYYYYAVITNTNENVSGQKTAVINSKAVQVSVRAAATTPANAFITIDEPSIANKYNYVRGYGGMNVAWTNFPEEKKEDTETMYNPDTGLGYNIMRIMIMPWNTNVDVMMNDLVTNGPRPDYYESVKIVNKYGGYVLASPWSPPKEWKSNNSINGGGHLIKTYYRQFANYLKNFAQHMYDRGAPIYAISIANEPNYVAGYDGCEWESDEMRNFFREVGHFTNGVRGYGGGREIPVVLTVNGESANNPNINFSALLDPVSRAAIDLYARHVYGSQTNTLWESPYADYKEGSPWRTECWMTEHNINSANAVAYVFDSTWDYVWRFMNDVDLVMRINNENAFVWWASKRFYSMLGDNQAGTTDGVPLPRGWGLSHYAKYTIDTTRVSISASGTNGDNAAISQGASVTEKLKTSVINSSNFHLDNLSAKITAYVSADGEEFTMVMWTPTNPDGTNGTNMGRIQINVPSGFIIGSASAVRSTSASSVMVPELLEVNAERTAAFVSLPASNLLSIRFTK